MACNQEITFFEKNSASPDSGGRQSVSENAHLWRALNEVQDPEFPMSIVEMGLVYGLEKRGRTAEVEMTFTSMGCPCMEMLLDDVKNRLLQEPGVEAVEVEIVWDPPWTSEKLSPEGTAKLATWGVAV